MVARSLVGFLVLLSNPVHRSSQFMKGAAAGGVFVTDGSVFTVEAGDTLSSSRGHVSSQIEDRGAGLIGLIVLSLQHS